MNSARCTDKNKSDADGVGERKRVVYMHLVVRERERLVSREWRWCGNSHITHPPYTRIIWEKMLGEPRGGIIVAEAALNANARATIIYPLEFFLHRYMYICVWSFARTHDPMRILLFCFFFFFAALRQKCISWSVARKEYNMICFLL